MKRTVPTERSIQRAILKMAGVCFPDVLLTRGQYQVTPDLPFVPGSEVAGRVRSAPSGSGIPAWAIARRLASRTWM